MSSAVTFCIARKSKAMLEFERGVAKLKDRIERGEIKDPRDLGGDFSRILQAALPRMTKTEREEMQEMQLRTHQIGAETLAKHGHPVPGNDPRKPN